MRATGAQYPLPNKLLVLLVLADAPTPLAMAEVSRVLARRTLGEAGLHLNIIRDQLNSLEDHQLVDVTTTNKGDLPPTRRFTLNKAGRERAKEWRTILKSWLTPQTNDLDESQPPQRSRSTKPKPQ